MTMTCEEQRNLALRLFADILPAEVLAVIADEKRGYHDIAYVLRGLGDEHRKALEATVEDCPAVWAFFYARYVIGRRFPEGEAIIAVDAYWAYPYALNVICGRFPAGEATISQNDRYAELYSKNIHPLKGGSK